MLTRYSQYESVSDGNVGAFVDVGDVVVVDIVVDVVGDVVDVVVDVVVVVDFVDVVFVDFDTVAVVVVVALED